MVGTDWLTVAGWLAGPVVTAVIGYLGASLRASRRRERDREERREAEHRAYSEGLRVLLKERLYDMHETYVVRAAPMPYEAKERLESVYGAYHALGGNGTGTHVYEELMAAYVGGREERQTCSTSF